jgi:hypothetical protein
MALAVLLASLLVGALLTVPVGGRGFVISGVDVAAVGLAVTGVVVARRRRQLVVDRAMLAYAGLLAVVVVQFVVVDDRLNLLGGASRFVGPVLILFGLSQLLRSDDDVGLASGGGNELRWPELFAAFGGVLAIWIGVLLLRGLADPAAETFYDVKNTISMPLGASNYVAAFVLVPAVALVALGLWQRRYLAMAVLPVLGVVGTLSRGAFLGFAAGIVVAVAARIGAKAATVVAAALGSTVLVASVALGVLGTSIPVTASTVAGRLVLLEAAWDGFLANPILGVGLNNILEVTGSLAEPHVNAHNLLIHALVTTGILGAVAYLALWWMLGRRTALSMFAGDAEAAAMAAAAAALFVHAAAEALAYTRAVEALLAAMLAIAATRPSADALAVRPWDPVTPDRK